MSLRALSACGPVTHLGGEKRSMKFKATTASVKNREADVTGPTEVAVTYLCPFREEGQLALCIRGGAGARALVRSVLDCESGPN